MSSTRVKTASMVPIVAALALALASCEPMSPADTPGVSLAGPSDHTTLSEARFVLHSADLQQTGWPEDYLHYALFVCNMAMTADEVAQIRLNVPGAMLLVYINAQTVPVYTYDEPIYQQLSAMFDTTLCLTDLVTDRMMTLTHDPSPNLILMQESADLLVAFHRDVTMIAGWDGLYIDQCNELYPDWKKVRLQNRTESFDIDGDRIADTLEELDDQYELWKPYFLAELRAQLGPEPILLGNAGGALVDPHLNGITIENVGTRFDPVEARRWVLEQWEVSVPPVIAGCWASRTPSLPFCQEFALDLGVYFGDLTRSLDDPPDQELPDD